MKIAISFKIATYLCSRCRNKHIGFQVGEEKIEFMCNDGFIFYKPITNPMIVWEKSNLKEKNL